MDFTQILLISYLALFKWISNHLSDNYFFLFDKIKSYFTTRILCLTKFLFLLFFVVFKNTHGNHLRTICSQNFFQNDF